MSYKQSVLLRSHSSSSSSVKNKQAINAVLGVDSQVMPADLLTLTLAKFSVKLVRGRVGGKQGKANTKFALGTKLQSKPELRRTHGIKKCFSGVCDICLERQSIINADLTLFPAK